MSRFKTLLSARRLPPHNLDLLKESDREDVERELDFIPADRLTIIMQKIGQDRFVHLSGRSWKQVSRYLRGDKVPSEVLVAIAGDTGASIDWLAKGDVRTAADVQLERQLLESKVGGRLVAARHPRPEAEVSKYIYGIKKIYDRIDALDTFVPNSASDPTPADTSNAQGLSDFVRLPVYLEVKASAGAGTVPASEQANNLIAFNRTFLRDQGGNPERCSIIFARGTSMKPTIPDGAVLVVDHSQREIENGCIYVFNVSDRLLVKRARWRMDGRLELVSDNKGEDYPVETFGPEAVDDLRVVGRVVYFCRTP